MLSFLLRERAEGKLTRRPISNKQLDAGVDEKIMLISRDEQSCLIVSYREVSPYLDASRSLRRFRRAELRPTGRLETSADGLLRLPNTPQIKNCIEGAFLDLSR